jgi:hypothetical protein
MPMRQSTVIIPKYADVFKIPVKKDAQIIAELCEYDSNAVINVCSKISITLNADLQKRLEVQAKIARDLLNDEHWQNVLDFEKQQLEEDENNPSITIFHHVPVMMLLKLNLENNTASGKDIQTDEDRDLLASWLIALTEKISQDTEAKNLSLRPFQYRKEALRMFFAKQFLLSAEPDPLIHLVGRSEAILGFIKADNTLDCQTIFVSATGLTIDEYQHLLMMLLTGWKILGDEKTLDEIAVRSIDQYFTHTNLPREKIKRFVNLLSFDITEYAELQKQYSTQANVKANINTNFICFIQKPLLKYGDNFMCVSPNFLALKMTEGVYRLIEDQVRADNTKHNKLAQMWGAAFEKYIHERFEQMLGDKYYSNPPALRGSETIDGIAELKDTVLLLEYKYAHWSYKARFIADRTEMKRFLEKIIRYRPRFDQTKKKNISKKKGLGQIRHYVDNVFNSTYSSPYNLENKALLPIVVIGEEYPFDPLNRMYIEGFAASQECHFKYPHALPFIVLSAEEIEILQAIIDEKGIDIVEQILTRYSELLRPSKSRTRGLPDRITSLRNELINEGFQVPNSRFMKSQLDGMFNNVRKYFKVTDARPKN